MKIRRLNYVVLLFALFTFLFCGKMTVKAEDRSGLTYYVDAEKGNDNESGRSPEEAWKTLEKVNSMLFQPGDTILFKAEGTWEGQLWPKGSGNEENSIIIDRYGEGKDPYIKGNMDQGAAVYLYNQQYWEINHLEITNNATVKGDRQGICFENQDAGILKHIYVKNCNIHDVTGVEITTGVGSSKCNGGIVGKITTQNPSTGEGAVKSKWEDIIIDGNSVKDLGREGIYFYSYWSIRWGLEEPNAGEYYPSTQVIVSNNKVENVDGDGIVITCCDGALVEHNYVRGANSRPNGKYHAGVWMWSSDNCVFRYNEVCETKTTLDGMAFDFDNCTTGNIYEYNYSHDNEGGFILLCSSNRSSDNIVRYNLSVNDGCVANSQVNILYNGQPDVGFEEHGCKAENIASIAEISANFYGDEVKRLKDGVYNTVNPSELWTTWEENIPLGGNTGVITLKWQEKHPIREITMYHYTDTISAFPESVLFYSKEDNEKLIEYVSNEPEEVYSEDGKNLYAVTYEFTNDLNTDNIKIVLQTTENERHSVGLSEIIIPEGRL